MTFAHISDTHLGYRAYGRTTAEGKNQREVDVLQTFKRALDAIQERDPDVVVHAGDLFHVVRPSNYSIVHTFRLLSNFQEARKGRPFILIGGNHDAPRMSDDGCILDLFRGIPGLQIAWRKAERFEHPDLNLDVLCVPSNSIAHGEQVEYLPSGTQPYSLLVLHGLANQAMPEKGNFDLEEAHHERWTYVAMGDYHVHRAFGRNCCYAGSTDFTSTNIWEEIKPGAWHRNPTPKQDTDLVPSDYRSIKGWIWYDTELARAEFVPVQTRTVIDLDPIDAKSMDGPAIGDKLLERAQWDAKEDPVVRQTIFNVHPETRARIPQDIVRELKAKALHYSLDVRLLSALPASVSERTPGESLDMSWEAHASSAVLPFGMDRDRVTGLGKDLLREVQERETAAVEA